MNIYEKRRKAIAKKLADKNIALAMFEDTEGRRDTSVRYFTGQPGDALVFIRSDGHSILVPWDINMAKSMANADEVIAYGDFGRSCYKAMGAAIQKLDIKLGAQIDLPSITPYPMYTEYVAQYPDYDFLCSDSGSTEMATDMRAVKDDEELAIYKIVSAITDEAINLVEENVRQSKFKTEIDVALFIERFLREKGCERTGFDSLVAGPSRSFGIHAFPAYSSANFATDGLSILDFGLCYKGYTSDVTMTFVRNKNKKQAEMIELVKEAHAKAIQMIKPGVKTRDIAMFVDALFAKHGYSMPHGLGHGIGLEAHEAPNVNTRETNTWELAKGHIITIEPGLYDLVHGGVRLEDDILVTESGYEVLTHAKIVELS